jgi:hypothetical protein
MLKFVFVYLVNTAVLCYSLIIGIIEHVHCFEKINNMWFLGKRETVNAWKKADFDGFRDKDE